VHRNSLSSRKQKLFSICLQLLDDRIKVLYASLKDLTEGAENDTKSSAGDKHETARAMMQIEQENLGRQLHGLLKEKNELESLNMEISESIHVGSLIKTNHGFLFLSVAMGKIIADGIEVMVLSAQSPLGKKLVGLKAGNSAEVNGAKYLIQEVE
jgi:transcription elongation GreA/GreB family factor